MTAHPERKPDALDLAEVIDQAHVDLYAVSENIWPKYPRGYGIGTDDIARARVAANRVLAALDAYEART